MKKDIIDEKTQSLCTSQCLSFIDNSSIDKSCLNRSKQHKKFVNSDPFPEIYQRTHELSTNSKITRMSFFIPKH